MFISERRLNEIERRHTRAAPSNREGDDTVLELVEQVRQLRRLSAQERLNWAFEECKRDRSPEESDLSVLVRAKRKANIPL